MPCLLPICSQSDYKIQVVDINLHTEWQTVQIQISWLLQKPTDLDLHCLQRQGISRFSRTRVNLELCGNGKCCVNKNRNTGIMKTYLFKYIQNSPPKTESFQIKILIFLHISGLNIDCGYLLKPTHWGSSIENPQSMFLSRNKKNNVYPTKPSFTI